MEETKTAKGDVQVNNENQMDTSEVVDKNGSETEVKIESDNDISETVEIKPSNAAKTEIYKGFVNGRKNYTKIGQRHYQQINSPTKIFHFSKNVISSRVNTATEDMTEDEKKMLDFYKFKLTNLKRDNELLHKRIMFIVKENMRLLKMNPPLKIRASRVLKK